MKKHIIFSALLFLNSIGFSQNNIGIGTVTPTDQLHTTGTVRFEGYRGYGTRMVEMDSSGRIQVTGAGNVNSTTPSAPIPDNQCSTGTGVTSTITISGQPFPIPSTNISIRVSITHTNDAELTIFLIAPNGAVLKLASNVGAGGSNFSGTIFSDASVASITTGSAPFAGIFKPQGGNASTCLITPTLSSFASIGGGTIIPNGNWTIKIFDNSSGAVGTLDRWDISFSGPESFSTNDNYGYVPYFNFGNFSATNLYYASGYLGVGTSAPAYLLDVNGTFHTAGDISTQNINMTGSLSASSATLNNSLTVANTTLLNGPLQLTSGSPVAGKVLMATNNSGVATWQTPGTNISFDANLTASVSIPSGTYTVTTYTKRYEDGGNNLNTSTGLYSVPSAGVYEFHASAGWTGVATGTTINFIARLHVLYSGGGATTQQSGYLMPSLIGNGVSIETSHLFKLNQGDQVYLEVSHGYSSNMTLNGGLGSTTTTFSGVKLY